MRKNLSINDADSDSDKARLLQTAFDRVSTYFVSFVTQRLMVEISIYSVGDFGLWFIKRIFICDNTVLFLDYDADCGVLNRNCVLLSNLSFLWYNGGKDLRSMYKVSIYKRWASRGSLDSEPQVVGGNDYLISAWALGARNSVLCRLHACSGTGSKAMRRRSPGYSRLAMTTQC